MAEKKDYRDKLIAKGVPTSYIDSKKLGDRISSSEYKKTLDKWEDKQEDFYKDLPPEIADNPKFKLLPFDAQEMAVANYHIQVENNEDKARKMDEAFNMAVEQADPYWKQMIRIAQDETVRSFDEATGDYQSGIDRIQRRQTELSEDIALNKDRLSIDEQVELGRIDVAYDQQLQTVARSASEAGVTFGEGELSRIGQETVVEDEEKEVVESTKRQFSRQVEDLTLKASRGDETAKTELSNLERTYGDRIQDLGRSAEQYLGTETLNELGGLEGYDQQGDITGTLYENKVRDIETRKETFYNELNQESLNFNFL